VPETICQPGDRKSRSTSAPFVELRRISKTVTFQPGSIILRLAHGLPDRQPIADQLAVFDFIDVIGMRSSMTFKGQAI